MYLPKNKSRLDKVKLGINQCLMSTVTDEYETQCHDCPYYDPESTVEQCKKELKDDTLEMLGKLPDKKMTGSITWDGPFKVILENKEMAGD